MRSEQGSPGDRHLFDVDALATGTLPNLIVIGAQKCATTSLHYYLNSHPQIAMAREKELDFFVLKHNWRRGLAWYMAQFSGQAQIHGETSPNYTFFPFFSGVAERMYSVVPGTKLIYVVRDPIDRVVSGYIHACAEGYENQPIAAALANPEASPHVWRSQYYRQLEQYLEYFPQSQILVLALEDLYYHRQETMQKVFGFLGVDDTFYSRKFSSIKHPSSHKRRKTSAGNYLARTALMRAVARLPFEIRGKVEALLYFPLSRRIERPVLDEKLRKALTDYLADDVSRLRAYTGYAFGEWCL
jgi:hypothetical protein